MRRAILATIVCAISSTACGVKGDPEPYFATTPQQSDIKDKKASQEDGTASTAKSSEEEETSQGSE